MLDLITRNLDLWTSAVQIKSLAGRGSNGKTDAYGVRKLRDLVLELAVFGALTPRGNELVPASILLERIGQKICDVTDSKRTRKSRISEENNDSVQRKPLPSGWEWARLGEITYLITDGTHHTPKYLDAGIPFISVKDIDGRTVSFADCKYISEAEHSNINKRCNPERGDILLCRIGTLGRATIVDTELPFSLFVSVGLIKFPQEYIAPRYLHLALHSPLLLGQYDQIKAGGSHTNKLNLGDLPNLLIPIPPIAEQHAIVSKVDELMALCDQLEQQQTQSLKAHQTLVETLLGTLTGAASPQEFNEAWTRIANHFDTLFNTEHNIDQLKQAILQLAVMGKLAPQDPNDEAVQKLLVRNDHVRREVAATDRRADSEAQPILSANDRWITPETWSWRGLADLVLFVDYRGKTPEKQSSGIRLLTAKNVRKGEIDFFPEEFLSEKDYEEWMTRGLPKVGDILFTTEAPMGNAAVVNLDERFALAQRVICFQTYGALEPEFLVLQILSGQFQQILDKNGTGMTAKGIKASKLKQLPIAIPPLGEQKRIVARVEELMSLCDTLQDRIRESQTTQLRLADAIVEQAIA